MVRNSPDSTGLRWVRCGGVLRSAPPRSTPYTRWTNHEPAPYETTNAGNPTLPSEVHIDAILAILAKLQPLETCPHDGCLIRASEACPACMARHQELMA